MQSEALTICLTSCWSAAWTSIALASDRPAGSGRAQVRRLDCAGFPGAVSDLLILDLYKQASADPWIGHIRLISSRSEQPAS